MLISTKGRYGVMIMVYLAENYNNGHKPLKEIAASQDLSEKLGDRLLAEGLPDESRTGLWRMDGHTSFCREGGS